MRNKIYDFTFRIVFPIIVGTIIYFIPTENNLTVARNYLPDGLWAFSLTSCILFIWNGEINLSWLISIATLFVVFELMQSIHLINGTADINDIIIYFIFGSLALITNQILKSITITKL